MNLLYRSLSLYHILLGLDGHIKLVDFGVSKIGFHPESKTKSFCGASEFMAPEVSGTTNDVTLLSDEKPLLITVQKMLLDRPYNSSVDWWQLGIITYQMLTQQSPFGGDDEDEIYDSILADEPTFPAYMTMDTIDFIQKLLSKEPERRLGSGTNGAPPPDQVMAHSFFAEINWDDLRHKRVPGPFVPTAAANPNRTDTSNFVDSQFPLLDTPSIINTSEGMVFCFFF